MNDTELVKEVLRKIGVVAYIDEMIYRAELTEDEENALINFQNELKNKVED